jgi:hypothetical protein
MNVMVINIPNCIDEYTNFLLVRERETMNVMVINIPNCIDEYTNFLLASIQLGMLITITFIVSLSPIESLYIHLYN